MSDRKQKATLTGKALLEKLRDADWKKIIKQLHYYSLNRLKYFPQLAERYNLTDLAYQFADDAIRQVWMEERVWNINQYPDLYIFLKGAVDSIRYNFLKKKEVKITTYIDEFTEATVPYKQDDPAAKLEVKELDQIVKDIFDGDDEAYQVFDCLKNNMVPRDIAKELDIPASQVYNATKRIERKLTELRKTLS